MPVVRTDGRCTVTWLPNFLGWVVYHIFSPTVLRCARFAGESSAKMKLRTLEQRNLMPIVHIYLHQRHLSKTEGEITGILMWTKDLARWNLKIIDEKIWWTTVHVVRRIYIAGYQRLRQCPQQMKKKNHTQGHFFSSFLFSCGSLGMAQNAFILSDVGEIFWSWIRKE